MRHLYLLFGFFLSNLCFAQEPWVSQISPEVFSIEEKKQYEDMVGKDIQELRKESIKRWETAWNGIQSRQDWERFRGARLKEMANSLGEFPKASKPRVKTTGVVEGKGFRIENILFESRKGIWVSGNLYIPSPIVEKMPGILIVHAHHTPKEHGELQDMGMTWARAGCLVLVIDQFGHGERRLHPFINSSNYPKPFRLSRQDYFFRYDSGIQLHLLGDSLMSWMVWDIHRSVDLLLMQKGIDQEKIILLGSVAGGGDPAAVAAALDKRIQCAVPFNFGGPQPETRFPLPPDAATAFNYAGGGSWESTRNLSESNRFGFLPWVIVGSIAPRKLIYAHEFQWDQERDPVWKRLNTIYNFYDQAPSLAFTLGKGSVRGNGPESSHCTHIGPLHRVKIHQALHQWFGLNANPDTEYSNRVPSADLQCWTKTAVKETGSIFPIKAIQEEADNRIDRAVKAFNSLSPQERKKWMAKKWSEILGLNIALKTPIEIKKEGSIIDKYKLSKVVLKSERNLVIPLVFIKADHEKNKQTRVAIFLHQQGKKGALLNDSKEIARMVDNGISVCLPDLRGTGETAMGTGRGKNSTATAYSSSLLMEGKPLVGGQITDLLTIHNWLQTQFAGEKVSFILVSNAINGNSTPGNFPIVPRDDDASVPFTAEPGMQLVALATTLFDEKVTHVQIQNGISGFRSALDHFLVMLPHDSVIPGVVEAGDIDLLTASLFPTQMRFTQTKDAANRIIKGEQEGFFENTRRVYRDLPKGKGVIFSNGETSLLDWLNSSK